MLEFSAQRRVQMSSTNTSTPSTMSAPAPSTAKKVAKKTTPAASTTVPTPAVEFAVAAPAATPAPKKAAKKAAPAEAAPVAPTPVADATATPAAAEATLADELKAVQDQLTAIRDAANSALAALKRVGKRAAQEIKEARKNRRAKREAPADGEPRKPSNFEKPVPISDELSAFLGGGKNNQMSRSAVNAAIHKYLNENSLRTKHDIAPNAALKKLLGVDDSVKLTIFNMQTYLGKHYPKVPKA
jgi:chromatin remodeling complex protein RSC6